MISLRKKYSLKPLDAVKKGWGCFPDGVGEVWAYMNDLNDPNYARLHSVFLEEETNFKVETVKLLCLAKDKKCSVHFHRLKKEYFVPVSGRVEVTLTEDGKSETFVIQRGDDPVLIVPGLVHQMKGLDEENILLEISTLDTVRDSYRIERGD